MAVIVLVEQGGFENQALLLRNICGTGTGADTSLKWPLRPQKTPEPPLLPVLPALL